MEKKTNLVWGVGINDSDYQVKIYEMVDGEWEVVWWCPYYVKWCNMLRRCYSKKELEKYPTYKGCSVCEEWLLFSNFHKWMKSQEWQDRCLDKDFLVEGNMIYSPSTCIFIPHKVNTFIIACGKSRGDYPIGVNLKKGRNNNSYQSRCKDGFGKELYLGCFSTPQKAHQAWLRKKLEVCNEYLVEFKDESLISEVLLRVADKIKYHIDTNTELRNF